LASDKSKPFDLKRNGLNLIISNLTQQPKEVMSMELTISDKKTKELLTEVLIEMMQQKREVFYEIFLDALEDVGLANAITEGRQDDFVGEDKIISILEG
jgi:hypothetical protein